MQLGETIATYDVALALRGESGKFDVTSPTGDTYHILCTPNHSITNLQWSGNGANPQPFLIRKVAEPVSSAPARTGTNLTETPTQIGTAKTPFLLSAEDNGSRSERRDRPDAVPELPQADPEMNDVSNLDLLYVEGEPQTRQPTAWVCLRSELQNDRGKLVTNACTTFNEFDAEIRRLHAQLDDIRYRARKRFYQAQVVAAGA
jgi:hypothetical protein